MPGGEVIISDKGYVIVAKRPGALILRPKARTKPDEGPHLVPIRQCIESIFWTLKDRLGRERHSTSTLQGLQACVAAKLLALAAGGWLSHYLSRPTRAFADLAH